MPGNDTVLGILSGPVQSDNIIVAPMSYGSGPNTRRTNSTSQSDGQRQTDSSLSSVIKAKPYIDLINKLKNMYQTYTLPTVAWQKERNLDFEKYFIDLKLTESEKLLKMQDIFKPVNDTKSLRILIEGQPRFGKTTLAKKLAFDWAKGKNYVDFELVVLVPLRQLGSHELGDAIVSTTSNTIRQMIDENANKTLLILDGLDETTGKNREIVTEILYKKQHPRVTVIAFSRSNVFLLNREERKKLGGMANMSDEYYDKRLSIIGIQDINSKKEFLDNICSKKSVEILENHNLLHSGLLDSPSYLMLASVIIDDLHNDSTKTDFYKHLFNAIIKQSCVNGDNQIDEDFDLFNSWPGDTKNCICEFGKLCVGKIVEGNFQFEKDDLIQKVYKMGFLTKQNEKISKLKSRDYFEVFHLSIMEFSSAYYLWEKLDFSENLKQSILEHFFDSKGTSQMLPFLAGFVKNEKELDWLLYQLNPYKWIFKRDIKMTEQFFSQCPMNVVSKSKHFNFFISSIVEIHDGDETEE